jgi:hypothetical protein
MAGNRAVVSGWRRAYPKFSGERRTTQTMLRKQSRFAARGPNAKPWARESSSRDRNRSGGSSRMRKPIVSSLGNLTLQEARAYLRVAGGDELSAAISLALDRNLLEGLDKLPDETEIHHALFLLCRARGLEAPSFDTMRVELRARRVLAA